MPVLSATVQGQVQGVGFRWFARTRALALGLTGRAANRPDGSVEIVAEGPQEALETFLRTLKDGPRASHVTGIEHVLADGSLGLADFTME
jgi:acylphosphatase